MNLKKKNKKPFFSVVTVVKNDEKILKTINSILLQTINDYEYIIIDGKSTDKTYSKILKYKKKLKKFVHGNDKGYLLCNEQRCKVCDWGCHSIC